MSLRIRPSTFLCLSWSIFRPTPALNRRASTDATRQHVQQPVPASVHCTYNVICALRSTTVFCTCSEQS